VKREGKMKNKKQNNSEITTVFLTTFFLVIKLDEVRLVSREAAESTAGGIAHQRQLSGMS
jgi:hypothetical protein